MRTVDVGTTLEGSRVSEGTSNWDVRNPSLRFTLPKRQGRRKKDGPYTYVMDLRHVGKTSELLIYVDDTSRPVPFPGPNTESGRGERRFVEQCF